MLVCAIVITRCLEVIWKHIVVVVLHALMVVIPTRIFGSQVMRGEWYERVVSVTVISLL